MRDSLSRIPRKREAEGRGDEQAQQRPGQEGGGEREVEEGQRRVEDAQARQARARHAGYPVITLGEGDPPEGQAPDHHAERERDHEEVRAGGADGDEAEDGRGGSREQHAGDETAPEADAALGGEQRHRIGAHAPVRGMAQGRHAGIAQQHVEAHGEDGDDEGLGDERERIRGQERAGEGEEPGGATGEQRAAAHHERPKRPVGRMARMAAMGAKSVK